LEGDEILIAPGTYFETVDLGSKNLTLRGSGAPGTTTINSFGQSASALEILGGQTTDTRIENLRFTSTLGGGFTEADDRGGGIWLNNSDATIIGCIFEGSYATNVGGGLYCNAGTVIAEDCTFVGNVAGGNGGAVYLNNCTSSFLRTVFDGNAGGSGAGVALYNGSTTISECAFVGNLGDGSGGGLWVHAITGTIERTEFTGNLAERGGAILFGGTSGLDMDVRDCVMVNNEATFRGGAIFADAASQAWLYNTTMVGNTAPVASGAVHAGNSTTRLYNCIVWDNPGGQIQGTPLVRYSNVQGSVAGEGNIDTDPMFVSAVAGDLRLQPGSPSIDAGDATQVVGGYPVDFDGDPRAVNDPDKTDTGVSVLGLAVDMGAFERQAGPVDPEPACDGDIDGTGVVGFSDLTILLNAWGNCP
jgi:predicted outer membrane repeat protein